MFKLKQPYPIGFPNQKMLILHWKDFLFLHLDKTFIIMLTTMSTWLRLGNSPGSVRFRQKHYSVEFRFKRFRSNTSSKKVLPLRKRTFITTVTIINTLWNGHGLKEQCWQSVIHGKWTAVSIVKILLFYWPNKTPQPPLWGLCHSVYYITYVLSSSCSNYDPCHCFSL